MIIRLANLKDLEQVVELFELYLKFYNKVLNTNSCKEFVSQRLKNADSIIYVAQEESGQILGFLQLYPIFSSLSLKRSWVLNDLFVKESVRGKDIGKSLLKAAEKHSIESGANGLSLQTSINNKVAQALYESIGWVKDSKYYTYYLNH